MTWIRKKKKYTKPRRLHDEKRIEEENQFIRKYGLKNKKEVWKADAAIERIRSQATKLITASTEEQKEFLDKLNKIGLKVEKIADVLALDKEDWLKRRLQSILVEKKMAKPREARQLIVHKHVLVNGKVVNVPSYVVKTEEENKIEVRLKRNTREKKEIKASKNKQEK